MKAIVAVVLATLVGCDDLVSDDGQIDEIAAIGDVVYFRFDTECSLNYYCDDDTELVGSLASEIGYGQYVRVWYEYDSRPRPQICCSDISESCGVERADKIELVAEP